MEVLPAITIGIVLAVPAFLLGWDAGRWRNRKFEKAIRSSYERLLNDQKELRETDAGSAYNKGWNEGYTQGSEDAKQGIYERIARYQ